MQRFRLVPPLSIATLMLFVGVTVCAAETSVSKPAEKKPAESQGAVKAVPKTAGKSAKKTDEKKVDEKKADEKKADEKKGDEKPAAKPAVYQVRLRPFKIEFTAEGSFESPRMAEVLLRAEEWSEFEVLKAAEHGALVKRGDVLVQLNTERIDRAISDLQRDVTLAQLAARDAEAQLAAVRSLAPLDDAAADRSKRVSDEDLAHFLKTERPMAERSANFMAKMAENTLAYEQEELRQLEKMYKADDLVEETEEIILRRARDNVERAKFMVERYTTERDHVLKTTLPRAEESAKHSTQKQTIDYAKTKALLPIVRHRVELALEKAKVDASRGEERLKRLLSDRSQMTVKAPASGILYYGRCVRGKWAGGDTLADKFRRGGRLANEEVFMTIVDPQPTSVRLNVAEKQIRHVKPGVKATLAPAAFPDVKLGAVVQRVAAAPSGGQFDASLTVAADGLPDGLLPGMVCEVRFRPYQQANALTIPLTALGGDDLGGDKGQVTLVGKDGKQDRREVTIGKRNDKQVEVLKGLAAGDQVLAEFPKDKD